MMPTMLDEVFLGDCLDVMRDLPTHSVDVIYLDPPFFTNKTHSLRGREGMETYSFDDVWSDDADYLKFLLLRITEMHRILKDSGTIFIHCDRSGQHLVRYVLERVFGRDNFQSEIIWSYRRWSNSKRGLLPCHQNIYFFSKSKQFKFNRLHTAYSTSTNVDQILQKRTRDKNNKSIYQRDPSGTPIQGPEKRGVPLGDVWDIPYLNPKAKERVGYPTQKPLLLLEQIIRLTSDKGDVVLDPFCGSGTTCVAAMLLGRRFVGIDQSSEAVALTKERLLAPVRTHSKVASAGRDSFNQADKDVQALLRGIKHNIIHRNRGIDAILVEQFEGTPILVRSQKDGESLLEAIQALSKAMKTKGSRKSFLIQTHPVHDTFEDKIAHPQITILKSISLRISESVAASVAASSEW